MANPLPSRSPRRVFVPLLALALMVVLGGCGADDGSPAPAATSGAPVSSGPSPSAAGPGSGVGGSAAAPTGDDVDFGDIPSIIAGVEPSVVSIIREGGEGSGVVWDASGIVITNHHVIEGVTDVVVAFADGTRVPGEVQASDPRSDLAVVRVDRQGLPAATFADEIPPVGTLTIALGNPLGFENSATIGILSGTHRAVPGAAQQAPALVDLLQTDAAISPGNSGGALVGPDGSVIGINVAYIPPQARAVAIGFAIPATTVSDVVGQLLEDGTVAHPYLGVAPVTLTGQIAAQFGLSRDRGALVMSVSDGSPAAQAGIEPGDVIVAVDGQELATAEDLLSTLRQHEPGDEVTITIVRDDEERQVEVTLAEFPTLS